MRMSSDVRGSVRGPTDQLLLRRSRRERGARGRAALRFRSLRRHTFALPFPTPCENTRTNNDQGRALRQRRGLNPSGISTGSKFCSWNQKCVGILRGTWCGLAVRREAATTPLSHFTNHSWIISHSSPQSLIKVIHTTSPHRLRRGFAVHAEQKGEPSSALLLPSLSTK